MAPMSGDKSERYIGGSLETGCFRTDGFHPHPPTTEAVSLKNEYQRAYPLVQIFSAVGLIIFLHQYDSHKQVTIAN